MQENRLHQIIENENELGSQMFLSGWFTDNCLREIEPDYGYPKNHLPESILFEMEIETGFLVSQKKS